MYFEDIVKQVLKVEFCTVEWESDWDWEILWGPQVHYVIAFVELLYKVQANLISWIELTMPNFETKKLIGKMAYVKKNYVLKE